MNNRVLKHKKDLRNKTLNGMKVYVSLKKAKWSKRKVARNTDWKVRARHDQLGMSGISGLILPF